jgi:hypothetical protein
MSKKKKWLLIVFCIGLISVSSVAFAEMNVDLRVKAGSAAGVDTVEFTNIAQGDASQKRSGNFQIEVAFTPQNSGPVNFVGTVGLFSRDHEGHVDDPVLPTDVKYEASGLSGSAGISIKANELVHFEGRFELALGRGKPTLSTPGFVWNMTQDGAYTATGIIFGGYITMKDPRLQIGLELGAQSFTGKFQIWNNGGYWSDGEVKGSGGTANLVVGYRF